MKDTTTITVPMPEWLPEPDNPPFNNPGALEALNVTPRQNSYGPLPSLTAQGDALGTYPIGAISTRSQTGSVAIYAGTATALYRIQAAGNTDVSRSPGVDDYATTEGKNWSFAEWLVENKILAANGTDEMQVAAIASGSFADLTGTGTPPISRYLTTTRDHVVAGNISTNESMTQWSGWRNHTQWNNSPATNQSDFQIFDKGGRITGLVGVDANFYVLRDRAIDVMANEGPPRIFYPYVVSLSRGCNIPQSVVAWGGAVYFWSFDGFYRISGQQMELLSAGRWERWLWQNIDSSNLHRVSAAVCPLSGCYFMAFPSTSATDGNPDSLFMYSIKHNKGCHGDLDLDFVFTGYAETGYTLDDLSDIFPLGIDQQSIAVDSLEYQGSDKLVRAAFDADHKYALWTGPSLAATVDTTEANIITGHRAFVTGARPLVDGGTPSVRVLTRDTLQEMPAVSDAVAVEANGSCPIMSDARYHRGRVEMPAEDSWRHIHGLEIEAQPAGLE